MSMLSLRLPDSLHRMVREMASKDSISINQFIATAVAEKMSALLTEDYLEQRARRLDLTRVDRILGRVPDVPPLPGDEREVPKEALSVTRRGYESAAIAERPRERCTNPLDTRQAKSPAFFGPWQGLPNAGRPRRPPPPRQGSSDPFVT